MFPEYKALTFIFFLGALINLRGRFTFLFILIKGELKHKKKRVFRSDAGTLQVKIWSDVLLKNLLKKSRIKVSEPSSRYGAFFCRNRSRKDKESLRFIKIFSQHNVWDYFFFFVTLFIFLRAEDFFKKNSRPLNILNYSL